MGTMKRENGEIEVIKEIVEASSLRLVRASEPKAPTKIINKLCAFTLAEVTMAKRVSDKASSLRLVRASEPKAPTRIINKLCAFTLAEVLITLAIIGVVAALTIPTVVRNYQKQQTIVKLKKAYSEINQAFQMAQIDYGEAASWDYSSVSAFADTYIFPYLKLTKVCKDDLGECFTQGLTTAQKTSALAASGYAYTTWTDYAGGWVYVGLDGKKSKKLGRDIFGIKILINPISPYENVKPGVYMAGVQYLADKKTREEIKAMGATGVACAALIILDGWQIKDDYPCW